MTSISMHDFLNYSCFFLSVEHYHMPASHAITIFFVIVTENVHWITAGQLLVFMFNIHNFHKDKTLKHSGGPIIMVSFILDDHERSMGEVTRILS